ATVSGVATPANFSLTNTGGAPASITATGGTSQSAAVNTSFGTAEATTTKDNSSNRMSGETVTFTTQTSGASGTFTGGLTTTTATTICIGVSTAQRFLHTFPTRRSSDLATVSGVATPANFSLTNTGGAPASITATGGTSQSAAVNTSFGT